MKKYLLNFKIIPITILFFVVFKSTAHVPLTNK